jgi:hypothetical protein
MLCSDVSSIACVVTVMKHHESVAVRQEILLSLLCMSLIINPPRHGEIRLSQMELRVPLISSKIRNS